MKYTNIHATIIIWDKNNYKKILKHYFFLNMMIKQFRYDHKDFLAYLIGIEERSERYIKFLKYAIQSLIKLKIFKIIKHKFSQNNNKLQLHA